MNLLEGIEVLEGGSGRRFSEEFSVFRDVCFLGIPGVFSQENGMPENCGGVAAGLVGEPPEKEDSRDEEQVESEEKDWDRREES